MPPATVYTRDQILDAALAVIEEGGLEALSARRVADEFGGSPSPVYSHFDSIDELAFETLKRARDLLAEYTTRPYTERPFLNMGTGVALFARDHSNLYRALYLEGDRFEDLTTEFLGHLREDMRRDRRFTDLSAEDRGALLWKMWIFTHGLASLIAVGLHEETEQDDIVETLVDVGSAIIPRSRGVREA
ncbi:MAG TPA: TetR/AcrR family transcriptional regulator [Longimicrobiales bacterium]|nr:TetR/AcrR family transcriptional regulator [Longimicrobiales bacterium]